MRPERGTCIMNEGNLTALVPLLVFMGIMVGIGFYVRRAQSQ